MPAATTTRRTFEFATTTLTFESAGETCRGRLYRPDRPATPPVVVMGPDFAAERTFGYPRYVEAFARAGYAAFLFDYRGSGASEGTPRNLVAPVAQVADWHAALDRVRRLDGIDHRRIALWGYGLGGGHVVRVAAESRAVAAAVAVAPILDGRAFARARSPRYLATAVRAGLHDRLLARLGRSHAVPVVGGPEEFGVLPRDPTGTAYLDCIPSVSDWQNRTPARSLLSLFRYRPLTDASDVACPTLCIAAGDGDLVPAETVATAADRLDDATFLRLPMRQMDALGDAASEAAAHQLAFLDGVFG
ncbi:alpha/beta hydrolase [Haloplanus halobius]|uniref:alpha/beta hydrolase n=1 Tax=Haloplanus halobius TaxID=2934938 RepID=UPI00200EBB3C|nr:alpha/beta fold hydrolase [Haloplanus sp. XH21]